LASTLTLATLQIKALRGPDSAKAAPVKADVIQMHETLQRPEKLIGSTYKLKVPDHVSSHAMYITINDVVLNEGTEHELRRPFRSRYLSTPRIWNITSGLLRSRL